MLENEKARINVSINSFEKVIDYNDAKIKKPNEVTHVYKFLENTKEEIADYLRMLQAGKINQSEILTSLDKRLVVINKEIIEHGRNFQESTIAEIKENLNNIRQEYLKIKSESKNNLSFINFTEACFKKQNNLIQQVQNKLNKDKTINTKIDELKFQESNMNSHIEFASKTNIPEKIKEIDR